MRNPKTKTGILLILILASLSVTLMGETGLPAIQLPSSIALEDTVGYIRIKNLNTLLENLDYWASRINPQMPPNSVRMMVGQYMGDPTLAGLDSARSPMILILNPKKYPNPLVLYLPVKDAAKIQQGIQAKGSFTAVRDQTLIAGDDQSSVMKGVEYWGKVKSFAAGAMDTDAMVYADVEKLMSLFQEDIKQKIKEFQAQMSMMQQMQTGQQNMAAQQKQMEAQMDAAFKMLQELKTFSLKTDVKKEGLLPTMLLEAKPQSELASLFSPKKAPPSPTLIKMVPDGAVKLSYAGDSEAVAEFGTKMTDRFMNSGAFTPEQIQEVKKYQQLQKETMGDQMAGSLFAPGVSGINGVMIYKIKDEKKALELIRQSAKQAMMANNPASQVKINAKLSENVRKLGDVNVHKLSVQISSDNPMAAQSLTMFIPGGVLNFEMAIVDKNLVYSLGTSIDQIIKQLKSGSGTTTLAAFSDFSSPGQLNVDINPLGVVKGIMGPMLAMIAQMSGSGQNPLAALDAQLPPITLSGTMNQGKMMGNVNLKLDTILKMKEAVTSFQKQMAPPSAPPSP